TVVIAPMFPLGRQALEQAPGWARLRDYLATQGWSVSSITASLEGWQFRSIAWPWGVEQFFYETLCSPLAYLPATGLLCAVDVEDNSLTLSQLSLPDTMLLGETTVPLPEAHLLADTALAQQLQDRTDVALRRYDTPETARSAIVLRPHGTPQFFGGLDRFIAQVRQWQAAGLCILVLCHSYTEIRTLLAPFECAVL